ncbi:alpha/beta hydrolase [Nocardia sp.]|uniref:alpha/beta hydrolase n=1 Tax=Nocardia sp. TaxID=1821 RepID=UPI0026037167|nr:alpha/beta hydrolase [Nocardia sp.]
MTYTFDPELAPWVDRLRPADYKDVPAARAQMRELFAGRPQVPVPDSVGIRDLVARGENAGVEVPVRVYTPVDGEGALPALLYVHGGGFVLGDLEMVHAKMIRFAAELGIVVVSVDYRLAPEHPFPAGLEDSYAALQWAVREADELRIDITRIGVAGDSAGGAIAAGLVLFARDQHGPELCFQLLDFPATDDRLQTPSATEYADTPNIDGPSLQVIWRHYLGAEVEPGSAEVSQYAAVARAADLSGLPPTYISTSQFDPVRDDGIDYAQRLARAGVPTELHLYPGTFHGSGLVADAAVSRRAAADQLDALRRGLRLEASASEPAVV